MEIFLSHFMNSIAIQTQKLAPYQEALKNHSLYSKLNNLKSIQIFMEHHVFAVWDFMVLLKALQRELTCVEVIWFPTKNSVTRRFINEIVLGEESDLDANGNASSHYEMYVEAMKEVQANTNQIEHFLTTLKKNPDLESAMESENIAPSVRMFLQFTFEVIQTKKPHIIAAVFTFGREDLIPMMFTELVTKIEAEEEISLENIRYYFERHIELDGDTHGPIALQMLEELCENDELKWNEAIAYSIKALQHRAQLWDAVSKKIATSSNKNLLQA